jgi:hypothetical protein
MPPRRVLLGLGAAVFAILTIVFLGGCLKGPTYTYELEVSEPYNVTSGDIFMRVNATAVVAINNSGGGELRYWVDGASLTANYEDGRTEMIQGFAAEGSVPAGGSGNLVLEFTGVPAKYRMVDSPPRLHSLIGSYDVNVTFSGQTQVFFIWTPAKTDRKDMRIPLGDIEIGGLFDKFKDTLQLPV